MTVQSPFQSRPGRGALSNVPSRYLSATVDTSCRQADPDEQDVTASWQPTRLHREKAKTIVTRNDSPDVPFEQSINPYRGCEHGCVYCFARPSHARYGLSPGLDFETEIFWKPDAAELLTQWLSRPGYRPVPIHLGSNTDPYQPVERRLGLTRSLLDVLVQFRHPVTLLTKSALIERDLDLLRELARRGLTRVAFSLTTRELALKRTLEPRAASPQARLRAMRTLTDAGIPVTVMVAPVIPGITDHEMEDLLAAAREAGATRAGWILLRLPLEVEPLMREWLQCHFPDRAARVLSLLSQCHNGPVYEASFGVRQRGRGPVAQLLRRRFDLAIRRFGYCTDDEPPLDISQFRRGGATQMNLW
jgi:DNA repair photolyase